MLELFAWRAIEKEGRLEAHGAVHGLDADFGALEEHPEAWTEEEIKEWVKPFSLLRRALAACPWMEGAEPSELALRQMLSRIDSNCFGVIDQEMRVVSQGVYVHAAMFNHSCDPNCRVLEGNADTLTMVTKRAVAEGEELCISYINPEMPLAKRQSTLSKQYRFICGCNRCEHETKHGSAKVSYKGKGGPPTKRTNAEKKARRAEKLQKAVEKTKKKAGGFEDGAEAAPSLEGKMA